MTKQPEFYPDFSPAPAQWEELKAAVGKGHLNRQFYMSMNGLLSAKSVKLAVLASGSEILAFSFYADRSWFSRDGGRFTGRSLGLITTLEAHQGSGFAKKLIYEIMDLALEENIHFLYLQGIPNFYSKFGFHGFAPKRKFVFNLSLFTEQDCKVSLLSPSYYESVKRVYQAYSRSIGNLIVRSEKDWFDLFHSLSFTFLFYKPYVITDSDGRFIGYFSLSPTDPTQVREFAFEPTQENAFLACSALAVYVRNFGASRLEVFSPATGPVYSLCSDRIDSDFICYIRPSSSNMIKWLSGQRVPRSILESFIFQGDNL